MASKGRHTRSSSAWHWQKRRPPARPSGWDVGCPPVILLFLGKLALAGFAVKGLADVLT